MAHVKHFASIENIPAHRWHDLNLALMIEAGAGGGIEGLKQLLITAFQHNSAKEHEKANTMLANAIQNIALAENRQSMIPMAFASTICMVGNRDVSMLATEGVLELIETKQSRLFVLLEKVNALKKKWMLSLRYFFLK